MHISSLISVLFQVYNVILLVRVVMSWVRLPSHHPLMQSLGPLVYGLTEPLLRPIRTWLRPYQGNVPLDFSPLLLMVGLSVLESLLLRILYTAGL